MARSGHYLSTTRTCDRRAAPIVPQTLIVLDYSARRGLEQDHITAETVKFFSALHEATRAGQLIDHQHN